MELIYNYVLQLLTTSLFVDNKELADRLVGTMKFSQVNERLFLPLVSLFETWDTYIFMYVGDAYSYTASISKVITKKK